MAGDSISETAFFTSLKEAVRAAKAAGLTALSEGSVVELRGELGRVNKGLTVEKTRALFNDLKKAIPDFALSFDGSAQGPSPSSQVLALLDGLSRSFKCDVPAGSTATSGPASTVVVSAAEMAEIRTMLVGVVRAQDALNTRVDELNARSAATAATAALNAPPSSFVPPSMPPPPPGDAEADNINDMRRYLDAMRRAGGTAANGTSAAEGNAGGPFKAFADAMYGGGYAPQASTPRGQDSTSDALRGRAFSYYGSFTGMAMGGYEFVDGERNRDVMLMLTEAADCVIRDLRDYPGLIARSTALECLTRSMGALELYDRAGNDWTFARVYRKAGNSFVVDNVGLQNSANIIKVMDKVASRKNGNSGDRGGDKRSGGRDAK